MSASVAVCVVARDEADVIAQPLRQLLAGSVDEWDLYVVDGGSTDATADVVRGLGVELVDAASVSPELGPVLGKGDSMWRAATVMRQDVLVFFDADIEGDFAGMARRLIGALASDDGAVLAKGYFTRREHRDPADEDPADQGGRVTELVARPLLGLVAPDYLRYREPLGGQVAVRRSVLASLPIVTGYGVEIAMLVDVVERFGHEAVVQVDLGTIFNPPRTVRELSGTARDVMVTLLGRLAGDADLADRWVPHRLVERPPLNG